MRPLIFLLLPVLLPEAAWAAEPASMGSALLQTAWALLVVAGLILALYGLSKKRLLLGKAGGKAITIIEMRPLLPKSTLALVEVRGKEYLLGVSNGGIHLLADLSAESGKRQSSFDALLTDKQ